VMCLRAKRVCVRRARVTCFPLCAQTALRFPPTRRQSLEGRIMAHSRLRSRWGWAERVFRSAHGGEGPILHPRPQGSPMMALPTQGMPSLFALPCNALHGSRCLVVWQYMAMRAPMRNAPTNDPPCPPMPDGAGHRIRCGTMRAIADQCPPFPRHVRLALSHPRLTRD